MKLNFRIDWGYQYLYSRRHYHPAFRWDGHIEVTSGNITQIYKLDYPVIWYGPGHCAVETPLPGTSWESTTKRGLSGIRIEADVEEDSVFTCHTCSGDFSFSAADVMEKGRILFDVGPKYLGCHLIVTRTGYFWFQRPALPGEKLWEADDLQNVPVRDWARMRTAWIAPGTRVEFEAEVPEKTGDFAEELLHIVAMAAPEYTPGKEEQIHDNFPLRLLCDGVEVAQITWFFREHDRYMQLLEDVWMRFQCSPGVHKLALCNDNSRAFLLINRLSLRQCQYDHLQFSLPAWALAGEEMTGRIFSVRNEKQQICWDGGKCEIDLVPGWNHFKFTLNTPGLEKIFTCGTSRGSVKEVYALHNESPEVTVGFDMTVVPHDDSGFMDWLLDYTERTQLGNLVVFRSFLYEIPHGYKHRPVPADLLTRWGDFCRTHHIHVEAATDFDDGSLVKAAGNMIHSVGRHEWPGAVYAFDPQPGFSSSDMKEAMEHYLEHLKIEVDRSHKVGKAAFGDASGGHRYCYMAGADFIRTETMVPHTQHLCSQARPSAEVFSSGEWGVHIAIQHCVQPYTFKHLGQYFLSIYQPWMMGASMIYEEDCLFVLFKEERQAWDDAMTKGKRDMTREFFKFVKTHPRKGKVERNVAFLEGRYAAPFNGFICDVEQTPDYSVWGKFGNDAPEWGHRQPEKCRQVIDVLMPGASTLPLRQRFEKRRFYFSGTPYGDFDEVPVEAGKEYLRQYKLLLNLGWNTMIAEDYEKLVDFVRNGGTLFTGLPQFSTHVKRDFLRDMADLALWNNGELQELCGIKVNGRSDREFVCQYNTEIDLPVVELSAIPSASPEEDGSCFIADIELAGAEVVVWDADNSLPLVVRHKVGAGEVYTLTVWAYPGHERVQKLSARLTAWLAAGARGSIYVEDPSGEVFWNVRRESENVSILNMLNTDWSSVGNRKRVAVHTPAVDMAYDVTEQQPAMLTVLPFAIVEAASPEFFVEVVSCDEEKARLRIHGPGEGTLKICRRYGNELLSFSGAKDICRELTICK